MSSKLYVFSPRSWHFCRTAVAIIAVLYLFAIRRTMVIVSTSDIVLLRSASVQNADFGLTNSKQKEMGNDGPANAITDDNLTAEGVVGSAHSDIEGGAQVEDDPLVGTYADPYVDRGRPSLPVREACGLITLIVRSA